MVADRDFKRNLPKFHEDFGRALGTSHVRLLGETRRLTSLDPSKDTPDEILGYKNLLRIC